ncbi:nuclear transport factor 2 family protein [Pyxidicoccus fallax]|uniref:Nuclear transport factor 2 family protein n=1 Tax=Pyxidicoccus fallax TaxID=394095 RepID=A0A848L523_9BACT|nr:nuclear transport factor 2 family protein [Pyxidicoccus fallax]NMO13779.1 nuclear transport factor 2 family protein [Pyxidicoccus fallax]NPC77034.1 nuclear transport factor 2 family protein [Pyxidicoccus fallax]
MSAEVATDARVQAVISYFRKVDARDASLLDLFTDDVQFCFPKFGLVHGKAALARFGQVMAGALERLEHDIDGFNYIVSGDFVVVEGTERGVTRKGVHWPDGVISQGRFCNVFQFEGPLIRRVHVYVDPDFTSADQERIRLFRGEAASGA